MLSDDRINNNLVMAGLPPHYYRTHPAGNGRGRLGVGPPGRPSPAGGPPEGGGAGGQAVILHPALFGPTVRQNRPVPNLLPRYAAPPYLHGPPPPGGPGHGPPPPNDPFIEEQVEMLAEKIEGLEGELRYAWRALDVLSQEYVKMWQRLEKMEGLLSEQQTVITQLIDLYSADSSDNGTNGLKSGAASPTSVATGISKSGQQQLPDENFYKALNAMHGDANTEMQLALSASQSMDDFISPEDDEEEEEEHSGKVVLPPKHENYSKQGTFTDFLKGFDSKPDKLQHGKKHGKKVRRGSQGSESDFDAKSVTSSIRSSLSGTVKSEEVGDFPLPAELSPSYENATPPTPPTISQFPKKKKKAVSPPQLQPKLKKSKVPKDANKSPLTVIGGKYSFSIDTENTAASANTATTTADALSSQHAANGKPLYPSLQTAMRPQNQPQSQKKSPPELKSASTKNNEQNRKLSLKEKRKLRAERASSELQPRDLDLASKNQLQPPVGGTTDSKSPNKSSGESESISPNNTVKAATEATATAGSESNGNNGVLMRTTSREFAVSRALGKYREKQKKQQKQARNSVGSNSDSQEDLDRLSKTPTPKTSPPRISMIDEEFDEFESKQAPLEKSSDTDDSPLRPEEFESEGQLRPEVEEKATKVTGQLPSQLVPESSSSEEVLDDKVVLEEGEVVKDEEYYQKEAEKATQQAEKAAQEAAIKAEKTAKQAVGVAKTAFGLFGASKFGKFAQQAAQAATQAAKESQQKISVPQNSRASSALGSRRQSTEESIDTDDEWYKHEIRELEQEAQEKVLAGIQPSESVSSKMNHVFIELTATVPRIEVEQCVAADRALKAKQNTFPPPRPPPEIQAFGLDPVISSDEDHKKVIMRFQSSEDDEMMEEEESSPAQQLDAKGGKGLRGRGLGGSESLSENDSDATQSGPDSLMEDTGGSSENILENKSKDKNIKEPKSSSSGGSRKSKKSVKTVPIEVGSTAVVESNGASAAAVVSSEEVPPVAAAAAAETEEQYDEEYYEGGYYDENGDWVETGGYYDENGDWVETGGYYDESGEWVEYAGYYDDNGEWVDVDPPENYKQDYYEEGGGGTVEDPPPAADKQADDQQNNQAGHFLANRGVAVFPQTQTAPLQKHPNGHLESAGALTSFDESEELYTKEESSTEVGSQEPMDDSNDEEMYSEEDELTPIQDAQSMGSGNTNKDFVSKSELLEEENATNEHLDNSETCQVSEKNDNDNSLVAILRKREGQGMKQWNALKQTLKDRKIDILEMVRLFA